MTKIKVKVLVFALLFCGYTLEAQNNTDSPYTMYGYGKLADKSFAAQRGMGGIGFGLRDAGKINPMNPASFSDVDSLTFMAELGITGSYAKFSDGSNKSSLINGNVDYFAMQFRLFKNFGIGLGLEPVSYVGYKYYDDPYIPEDETYSISKYYTGSGGLSKVYGDLSYNFFNHLSLGVKFSYMFGDIVKTKNEVPTSGYTSIWSDTIRSSGILYDLGLQYTHNLNRSEKLVFGAFFSPKQEFDAKVSGDLYRGGSQEDYYTSTDSVFEMPMSVGFGITYNKIGKLTLGADVLYEKWSESRYFNNTGVLSDHLKFNAGAEYIPDINATTKLFQRIRYRAGLNYTNSYIKVGEKGYKAFGASIGLGFPMVDRRSFVNLAFEYSMLQPEVKTYVKEQYYRLTLSYTFNQAWFFKQKIQ